jgi:hypothetical protein
LQVKPNQSFEVVPNELSNALEPLAGSSTVVTVRRQMYKKPAGKQKKADASAPLKLLIARVGFDAPEGTASPRPPT